VLIRGFNDADEQLLPGTRPALRKLLSTVRYEWYDDEKQPSNVWFKIGALGGVLGTFFMTPEKAPNCMRRWI